jgi:AcrR family transcriptional regulator
MLEEGYAGVSSRKVGVRAGLKSNLMHYHFATMGDLFIAAFQRREQLHMARLTAAAASDRPLHELWHLAVDAASSRLYLEFNALACHRPAVREVIARSNSRDRMAMTAALDAAQRAAGAERKGLSAEVVATAMAGMARVFATDRALGNAEGHAATLEFVERLLGELEPVEPGRGGPVAVQCRASLAAERSATQHQEIRMPSIHELELAHLPIASREFGRDPLPYFEAATGLPPATSASSSPATARLTRSCGWTTS